MKLLIYPKKKKVGTFGIVKAAISLLSIEETSNMDGLSAAFS
jgi:hypothetical protein